MPIRGRSMPGMRTVTVVLMVLFLCLVAFYVEASFGHDGLLCELGYDRDGDGTGTTGCT